MIDTCVGDQEGAHMNRDQELDALHGDGHDRFPGMAHSAHRGGFVHHLEDPAAEYGAMHIRIRRKHEVGDIGNGVTHGL